MPESRILSHTQAQPVDASACEAERIDCPGIVQSHGVAFALSRDDLSVTHVADPLQRVPAPAGGWPGQGIARLEAALGTAGALEARLREMLQGGHGGGNAEAVAAVQGGTALCALGRTHAIVEIRTEPDDAPPPVVVADWRDDFAAAMGDAPTVHALAQRAAGRIAALTGFDRVMVYRFAPDWSGEVIAEQRRPEMEPFLGLHYPATDIPSQARRLYLDTLLREIPDTAALPAHLAPDAGPESAEPVDLSGAVLRGISPYHLQYLTNMGVRATLVSSLLVDGRLWGLVACHHRSARLVSWPVRQAVGTASGTLSEAIRALEAAETERRARQIEAGLERIRRDLQNPALSMRALVEEMTITFAADGAAVVVDGETMAIGHAPEAPAIPPLIEAALDNATNGVATVDCLSDLAGGRDGLKASAGMAVVRLPSGGGAIALFRNEAVREISWGGDPKRAIEVDRVSGRLSPRRSFAVWKQTVEGRCRAWEPDTAQALRALVEDRAFQLSTDNFADDLDGLLQDLGRRDALHSAVSNAALEGMILALAAGNDGRVGLASSNAAFRSTFDLTADDCEAHDMAALFAQLGVEGRPAVLDGAPECEIVAWSPRNGARNIRVVRRNLIDAVHADGRLTWTIFLFDDITDLRREQQTLQATRDLALQEVRAKTEFLANMSHELRTPLNAILGYGEIVAMQSFGPIGNPKYAEYAGDIVHAGQQLLSLIENILELSRTSAGKRAMDPERIDLLSAVKDAVGWVRDGKAAADIDFAVEAPDVPIALRCDRTALRQIAVNLVGNAAKFSPEHGTVRIAVSQRADGSVELTVSDQGPGIPTDQIDRMFEPFQQGEGVYVRRHGGAGLGLSIVKSLVESMGGTVCLKSAPGRGTEAVVVLPASCVERDEPTLALAQVAG